MRRFTSILIVGIAVLLCQLAVQAQLTGSISGTVVDPNGAVVPGASIKIKGEGGQEFSATTNDQGVYRVPAVQNGLYTVTVTAQGFKTASVTKVKVDAGIPATVDAKLEVGAVGEVVEIASGGEVLQTQTATVGSSVVGRQITETPIASRDALDLVLLMPGTATVGRPRTSSINGLPKGAISITIDGVDVQDNLLRSSDGYFTYVRPRVDAIEEVTVTTAANGSDTGGDGAVNIKFVTKRGTNNWQGGGFYQRRHESLNANYWYNNRDRLARSILRLQQYGGHWGGPIPFLGFGEGVKKYDDGKDKRFFFVNYEEYRLPSTLTRTRSVLTTDAQQGIFRYRNTAGQIVTADLLQIAANANLTSTVPGRVSTIDPTVAAVNARIRASLAGNGTISQVVGADTFTTENFSWAPTGMDVRKFGAYRFDFNIKKKHSVEIVHNRQTFVPSKDFLNSQDEIFPGFPFYTQGSNRNSITAALRSSFGQSVVNEFRYAHGYGFSSFSEGISPADFDYMRGFSIPTGGTSPVSRNSFSTRSSPTWDWTDSLTWVKGKHTFNFGGEYKRIGLIDTGIGRIVPSVGFGIDSTETALSNTFNANTVPGASTAQLGTARSLYATLIGHVTSFTSTAYLTADGTYQLNARQTRTDRQDTYGLFAQDNWKLRPNLSVSFGVRWQPQGGYVITSSNYGRLNSFNDIFGLSGPGNLFKPGTLAGVVPTVTALTPGERAYPDDKNNFAPSFGFVWSPNFGNNGFLGTIFGGNGKSVLRGGYSVSFVREGTALIGSLLGANPGGNLPASRSTGNGTILVGTNFRDPGNPNLVSPVPCPPAPCPGTGQPITNVNFIAKPAFPLTLTTSNSANAFDPNLKTGSVASYTFGYQRELDRNTVVELRYVGNRGHDLFRQHNLNEVNVVENGMLAEFARARQNLEANIAANRCQAGVNVANEPNCRFNFAYFGPGTGTVPLPISLAYISGAIGGHSVTLTPGSFGQVGSVSVSAAAQVAANYSNSLFRNSAFAANLSRIAPSVGTFTTNLEGNAGRRANALAAGLPANFVYMNPTVASAGAFVLDNSARSWYNGGTLEVRRRLSAGLRLSASYTFSKAMSDSFASNSDNFADFTNRVDRDLQKGVAAFDLRHAFKLDATYDMPFGKGRTFFGGAGRALDAIVGGWTIAPVLRWQSGSPIQIGNATLVGMTLKELQDSVQVRKEASAVYWLPDDIILNSRRAFGTDALSSNGFGTLGVPTGRFIAPATWGDCQAAYTGQCGNRNLVIYGPSFFKLDASVSKRIKIGEKHNVEFRVTSLDVLNHPNFRVGGWGGDITGSGCCGTTFGQLGNTSAYQDVSTTNDPGGRIVDLMVRINW